MTQSKSFGYVCVFVLSAFITTVKLEILVQTTEESSTPSAAEINVTAYLSVSKITSQ